MTYHDFYAQLEQEHRSERIQRSIRAREGARARAARLLHRTAGERTR